MEMALNEERRRAEPPPETKKRVKLTHGKAKRGGRQKSLLEFGVSRGATKVTDQEDGEGSGVEGTDDGPVAGYFE